MIEPSFVVDFWREAGAQRWFKRSEEFDRQCAVLFLDAHWAASRRELDHWMAAAEDGLALLLLLDQIPRNLFRGSAHSYATDPLARHYAMRGINAGFDHVVEPALRVFFYMPFEHSEDIADQHRSLLLHAALPGADADRWARLHHGIIERFGRFPHRNAALGRGNTPEEQAFLDGGGFRG